MFVGHGKTGKNNGKGTLLFLCLALLVSFGCGHKEEDGVGFDTQTITIITPSEQVPLSVEVADTDVKRAYGLQHRQSMEEHGGMLFVFEQEAQHSFWMKNTYISLDILFIGANKEIVGVVLNTTPLSLESILSEENFQYALEVSAGFTEAHKINIGDRVEL